MPGAGRRRVARVAVSPLGPAASGPGGAAAAVTPVIPPGPVQRRASACDVGTSEFRPAYGDTRTGQSRSFKFGKSSSVEMSGKRRAGLASQEPNKRVRGVRNDEEDEDCKSAVKATAGKVLGNFRPYISRIRLSCIDSPAPEITESLPPPVAMNFFYSGV